jgi:hypothetical protein
MAFYPATRQHTNTHITYIPNTHIIQNDTTKTQKTKQKRKKKTAHKSTQTTKDILQPKNTAQKKERNKTVADAGLCLRTGCCREYLHVRGMR